MPQGPQPAVAAVFSDDFDDNTLNASKWIAWYDGSGPTVFETNQRLEIDLPATSTGYQFGAGYTSVCSLTGDFDIQVDFQLLAWPTANGVRVGLSAGGGGGIGATELVYGGQADTAVGDVYLTHFDDGVLGQTGATGYAGSLRLERLGSLLTGYYFDSGTWVPIHSLGSASLADTTFALRAWSHDGNFTDQDVSIAFDNFVVNEGELVCPPPPTYAEIAAHWAPVIYQDTDSTCAVADYITDVDYDGDSNTKNNWEHLGSCANSTAAHVYYWVVETEQSWYIGYSFYHPRDWGEYVCIPPWEAKVQGCGVAYQCPFTPPELSYVPVIDDYACHENDFEGIMLVIQKDGSQYGRFLLMGTRFHHDFRWYKDDDHSPSMDISGYDFSDDCDADPLTTCSDVDFDVNQPIAYSQAMTHSVIGSQEWEERDGAGNITNVNFPSGQGIVYRYTGVPEVPTDGNDRDVGYDLLSIQGLWDRQCLPLNNNPTFASWGVLAGDTGGHNSANAPWGQGNFFGLTGDAFFLDPGTAIAANFSAPVEDPLLLNYVGASFQANSCTHESAGVGVSATFDNVTTPGATTATTSTSGAAAPAGFQPASPGTYYDVSTTASFSGNVELCFDYAESSFALETGIHVFHEEGGAWVDVTTFLDPVENSVCGVVSSLSLFLLAELVPAEDYDLDGCTNAQELGYNQTQGGLRDPLNAWDYFNPTHDGKNRVDDIIAVVQHFGRNVGDPGYSTDYDRTFIGPNNWNLGPPNGSITVADILAMVYQFGHDCS